MVRAILVFDICRLVFLNKFTLTGSKGLKMPYMFSLTSHAVLFIFQMRFKVYLDEGHRVAEIFVSAATQCKDIVHRLQREIHATDCFLLEVWQGCGKLHAEK